MGSVTENTRMRDSASASAACLVETFNTWHNLIVASGMTQVSASDFSGQAGVFSESSGPGLTQVIKSQAAATDSYVGYKVYKHPTLSLYLRVDYVDTNQSSLSAASFARFRYQFATALNGSGSFDPAKSSNRFFPAELQKSTSSSFTVLTQYYPATYEKTTVSCGPDHFWIARDLGIETYPTSSYASLPAKADINSFGIFTSLTDPNIFCVVLSQYEGNVNGSRASGESATSTTNPSCLRYWLCNKGAWSILDHGAAGQLDHPRMTSTIDGIRVAQGRLVVNNAYHRFNFGFIPHKALNSFMVANMNITGVTGKYQALPYMGFANHSPTSNDSLNMSSLVFPLVT